MSEENKTKRPFYKPGYYPDLSNEEYHGSFGYGSTTLKILNDRTKAHMDYQRAHPKPMTDALLKGQLVHSMVLEPHKVEDEFAILPDVNRRTKEGKARIFAFEENNQGKLFVTKEQYNTATYMAKSIKEHPVMGMWFNGNIPGFAEQSIYYWYKSEDWDERNDYKTMLKVRPDWVLEGHPVIFDIKTTRDAAFSAFMKQARSLGYHMSAAMYLDGCNRNQDFLDKACVMAFTSFVWVVVENEPPYCATYYELGPEDRQEGQAIYHQLVRKLDRYNRSEWKGYGEQDKDGFITPEGRVSDMPRWGNSIV
jgi:hypothetical protein